MTIDNTEVLRAATALGVIGGSAQAAHRLLAALCDPSLSAEEIGSIIQREPGLAARVLKVANSAFYGRSREVTSPERALVVLGLDAVRGIAAAACLDRSIARRGESAAIHPEALVAHCVASGMAAEQIAKSCRRDLAPEAMIAALLHDFGVLVQQRLDSSGVMAMIEELRLDATADITGLEDRLVRIGHAQCAEIVFDAWRLPGQISAAVRFHHHPMAAPEATRELTAIVYLGIQVAIDAGFVHPLQPGPLTAPREPLLKLLRIEESLPQQITLRLPEQVLLVTGAAGT